MKEICYAALTFCNLGDTSKEYIWCVDILYSLERNENLSGIQIYCNLNTLIPKQSDGRFWFGITCWIPNQTIVVRKPNRLTCCSTIPFQLKRILKSKQNLRKWERLSTEYIQLIE
ncbi:hypothetical protein CEXT_338461 [Caerostris extrusa]|uniref:Uncharacterized protein n=1 Tax=Caerostris extrusa TaxID=172846 RepID=A0AAV4VEN4_CAEEX|nr:hypothetical protein CEXT_338461 [Caerostris extrusa]